jgi:hypothetical protein
MRCMCALGRQVRGKNESILYVRGPLHVKVAVPAAVDTSFPPGRSSCDDRLAREVTTTDRLAGTGRLRETAAGSRVAAYVETLVDVAAGFHLITHQGRGWDAVWSA